MSRRRKLEVNLIDADSTTPGTLRVVVEIGNTAICLRPGGMATADRPMAMVVRFFWNGIRVAFDWLSGPTSTPKSRR